MSALSGEVVFFQLYTIMPKNYTITDKMYHTNLASTEALYGFKTDGFVQV